MAAPACGSRVADSFEQRGKPLLGAGQVFVPVRQHPARGQHVPQIAGCPLVRLRSAAL
jgi:hypothetical protein